MENYTSKITKFIDDGHWLELDDYLKEQELVDFIEADSSFQIFIYKTIMDLIKSIGYSDSRFIQFEFGLAKPSNFYTESHAQDCFKSLLDLFLNAGKNDDLNKLFLLACKSGHVEMVKSFFGSNSEEEIVDINYQDQNGHT
jgi:hypothetical protein